MADDISSLNYLFEQPTGEQENQPQPQHVFGLDVAPQDQTAQQSQPAQVTPGIIDYINKNKMGEQGQSNLSSLEEVANRATANASENRANEYTKGVTAFEKLVANHPYIGQFIGGLLQTPTTIFFDWPMLFYQSADEVAWAFSKMLPMPKETRKSVEDYLRDVDVSSSEIVERLRSSIAGEFPIVTEEALERIAKKQSGLSSLGGHLMRNLGSIVGFGALGGGAAFFRLLKMGRRPSIGLTYMPKVAMTTGAGAMAAAGGQSMGDAVYYDIFTERFNEKTAGKYSPWVNITVSFLTSLGGGFLGGFFQKRVTKWAGIQAKVGELGINAGMTPEAIDEAKRYYGDLGIPFITSEIAHPSQRAIINLLASNSEEARKKILEVIRKRNADLNKSLDDLFKATNLSTDELSAIRSAIINAAYPDHIALEKNSREAIDDVMAFFAKIYHDSNKSPAVTPEQFEALGKKLTSVIQETKTTADEVNRSLWDVVHRHTEKIKLTKEEAKIVGKNKVTVFDLHRLISEYKKAARNATDGFKYHDFKAKAEQIEDILMGLDNRLPSDIAEDYKQAKRYYRYYKEAFEENPLVDTVLGNVERGGTGTSVVKRIWGITEAGARQQEVGRLAREVDDFLAESKKTLDGVNVKSLDSPTLSASQEIATTMGWQAFKTQLNSDPKDISKAIDALSRFAYDNAVALRDLGVLDDIRGSISLIRTVSAKDPDIAAKLATIAAKEKDIFTRISSTGTDNLIASIYNSNNFQRDIESIKRIAREEGLSDQLSKATVGFFMRSLEVGEDMVVTHNDVAKLLDNPKNVKLAKEFMTDEHYKSLKALVDKAKQMENLPDIESILYPGGIKVGVAEGSKLKAFSTRLGALMLFNKMATSNLVIQQTVGKLVDRIIVHMLTGPVTKTTGEMVTDPEFAKFVLTLAESGVNPERIIKSANRAVAASKIVRQIHESMIREEKSRVDRLWKNYIFGGATFETPSNLGLGVGQLPRTSP